MLSQRSDRPVSTHSGSTDEEYDYRIEKMIDEDELDDNLIGDGELSETFRQRQAAERLFGVLKDDDQKLTFNKTGFKRVKTQVFLTLIDWLLTALGKWKRNPESNLRSIK